MAISQLNIKRILALKSKNDAPIGPHGHDRRRTAQDFPL